MMDVSDTIIAKSDQLNADDIIEPITIKVEAVTKATVNGEKTFTVKYEGDQGRPFKPCKTVRRILIRAWGKDASQWAGRSMQLFTDPTVRWAGKPVGGIRIKALSHISGKMEIVLAEAKGMKKPHIIMPLATNTPTQGAPAAANPPPKQERDPNLPKIRLLKADGSEIEFVDFQTMLDFMNTNLPRITELERIETFKKNHFAIFGEYDAAGFGEWVVKANAIIDENINRLGGAASAEL